MNGVKTYQFICPVCSTVNEIELTPLMDYGAKDDYVSCWNCNEYLHIEFDDDRQHLIAKPYNVNMVEAMNKIIDELLWLL